jgi:hypothetical protein
MIESPGYQLTEVLHEGTATAVCGGSEVWDWLTVLTRAKLSPINYYKRRLIAQIPPENAAVAEALAKKVNEFRLDPIIDLTSND